MIRGFATWVRMPALCLLACLASTQGLPAPSSTLFQEDRPIELQLLIDLGALCREADEAGCEDVPAELIYSTEAGQTERLSIRVRTRGEFRLDPANCDYPPLFLLFGDDARGTLFESQDLLPMTTQCRSRGGHYRDWVLREYLAYRIYQLLTEKSVRTRLVQVTWKSPSGGYYSGPHWSFLSEHFRFMAARNNAGILEADHIELDEADPMELATLSVFQFMIGNTDWSAVGLHNILPIRDRAATGKSGVTGVPFDFDFSGLVNARYSKPPSHLPIRSVRQRLYRGFCNPGIDWDALFNRFQEIRPQVFNLLGELPGLTSGGRRVTRKYLQGFYKILDDPKRRKKKIIDSCRRPPEQ